MRAALRVLAPGFSTTLQDRGRVGWLRLGVPSSGALDPRALAIANLLVGNGAGEGALELTLLGGASYGVLVLVLFGRRWMSLLRRNAKAEQGDQTEPGGPSAPSINAV